MTSDAVLEITDLHKSFGGVTASAAIQLEVAELETHAVIGPNGAGKTTLISQIAGSLRPDRGKILFNGSDVTRLAPHQRARRGMARSFQITNLLLAMSVLDNVAMAVQALDGHSFRFWAPAREDRKIRDKAMAHLESVALAERARDPCSALSHGERRQLEIAVALAMEPTFLLLDEPTAGMGSEESQRMIATLKELKGSISMLLVEHDMDAVFALADRISVLVYGKVIATGEPEAIRGNEEVRRAYLGEG